MPAALLVLLAVSAQAAPLPPPSKEQIAKLIRQLGDNDFDTRETASRKLWEAGEAAEEAVKEAVKSKDAEISRRAGEISEKFKWGLYPDTPKNVADLIERYQSAEENAKGGIVRELFDGGLWGCRAVLKIARAETKTEQRASLMAQIANELPRAVPMLLEDNHRDVLERLVEVGLEHQVRLGISHYAAFWALAGKLDDRIAHFKALEKTSEEPKREAEILAYLFRANGDLPSAVEAAKRAEVDDLTDHLLGEAGDWKRLAERKAAADPGNEVERLAYRATYYRLAGQKKEMDETLAALRKLVEAAPPDDVKHFSVAKALLLNGRTAEGLEVLNKGDNQLTTFEILCARNQFKEAFELVDKARFADSKEAIFLEIAQARTLHLLGEKEKAAPLFAKYAAMVKEGTDVAWYENLVEAEFRAGLTDDAFAHAAKVLAASKDESWTPRLFGKLYPGKKQTAEQLWILLKRMAEKEDAAVRMKRLRALLDGKAPAKDVTAFLDDAAKLPGDRPAADVQLLVQGEVALTAKMDDRAIALFEKAGGEGWLRAGDVLAEKKEWAKASAAYRKAWEADRVNPLPLWLAGWSLKHAGKEEEGKQLMEQAHWLPLGAEAVRHQFALDLAKRQHTDASRQENDLVMKTGEPGSYYTGEATRRNALAALLRRDYAAAVDGNEQAMLRVLRDYINFVQKQGYVGVPAAIHRLRAAALLKAGKTKEALEEARLCMEMLPGNVEVPILLVPELEKRGMKKEADDLFERSLKFNEALCREWPNSPFAHNSVAWLRVCCRRDLDQALEHALKATKLAPKHAGHHDTLAEVYFQRGEKDKALEVQKKVVEWEPKRTYFRKQLKRIEAGDPKAERPMEEEDEDDDDD
jgi:predicted Zn-dependent protease